MKNKLRKSILITLLFIIIGMNNFVIAQRINIPLHHSDARFTLSAEKSFTTLGEYEEYFFYVQNNTNQEYKIVVAVTLEISCIGSKTFLLGFNKLVYLKPNGLFKPKDDYFHQSGFVTDRKCWIKEGDHYTILKGISYTISSVINVSEQKKLEERKKIETKVENTINQGYSKFKSGDYAGALKSFEQAKIDNEELKMTSNLYPTNYEQITIQIKQVKNKIQEADNQAKNQANNSNNSQGSNNNSSSQSGSTTNSGSTNNNSNNSQGSTTNSTSSPSTSSASSNTQQTINPNDPNPMTNGTSGNYQAPKSSSSNSSKQLTVEEQQSIQQGVAAGTELISDGVTLISDVLDVKKQRRESQYYSETDKVFAIGYSFSTSSWLGIDVSMFNPELGKLGWGVTLRFNPSVLWSDFNVGSYGDYRDHYLYDDDYSYTLLETGKKTSFNIGGSLNIGLSSWLFVQIGGGIGAVSTYSKYEITNATSSFQKNNIGDKFYTRKDEDRIMGFCNENNLVLRFTNVLCLKTGFATYNFKSPEFTFGILFMPSQ